MKRPQIFLLACILPALSANADLTDILRDTDVPLLDIRTVNGETPDCEYVAAPEGCWGRGITNATKVPARMVMTLRGDTIYDSGHYEKGESGLTIKIRGNASAYSDKKGYKLKLQKKADLLRRGDDKRFKDKDWVLLATRGLNYSIGFWLGDALGQEWTPGSEFVAVRLNDDYLGLYNLAEQVKTGGSRIDIDEEEGYLIEADAYWWVEDRWFDSSVTAPQLKYTFKYPDPEEITEAQFQYVKDDMKRMEDSVADGTFDTTISCDSFARWLVGWDILGGGDSGGSNMYIVKRNAGSPLEMGPLWDFDCILHNPEKWASIHAKTFWYDALLNSSCGAFRKAFIDIWERNGHDAIAKLKSRISDTIGSSLMPDLAKVITLEYTDIHDCTGDDWHQGEIDAFIEERDTYLSWLEQREKWISDHISQFDDGASAPAMEDGDKAVTYYDMQGHRLSHAPSSGIYIERVGTRVMKKTAAND